MYVISKKKCIFATVMDKIYATLSADIVDSTSLSAADTIKLKELLEGFFPVMKSFCDEAWGRVVLHR